MTTQYQRATPTTGQTVTLEDTDNTVLFIKPSGTLLALTVAFPATPRHGAKFKIMCSQIITTLTLTLPTSATLIGATLVTSGANFSPEYIYDKVNNELVRIN